MFRVDGEITVPGLEVGRLFVGGCDCCHDFVHFLASGGVVLSDYELLSVDLSYDNLGSPLIAEYGKVQTHVCVCAGFRFMKINQITVRGFADEPDVYVGSVFVQNTAVDVLKALRRNAIVLINCQNGLERAPALALAVVLLSNDKLNYDQAVSIVKTGRDGAFSGEF